jgi:hypothetical protein
VDTNVLAIVPEQMPFYEGRTYLNGVANLLPSRLYHTQLNLSEWLVDWIAPGSPGGYGFSLSAEAYMNFGRPGVLGFFMLTAFIQIWLVNRFRMSDFYAFFSVFYTGIWMYSLRNDSFTMIKSCTYAIAFYGLAQALSNPAWRFERLFAPKSRAAAAHALRRGQRVLQSS